MCFSSVSNPPYCKFPKIDVILLKKPSISLLSESNQTVGITLNRFHYRTLITSSSPFYHVLPPWLLHEHICYFLKPALFVWLSFMLQCSASFLFILIFYLSFKHSLKVISTTSVSYFQASFFLIPMHYCATWIFCPVLQLIVHIYLHNYIRKYP